MSKIDEYVHELLEVGVEIEVSRTKGGYIWYTFNTGFYKDDGLVVLYESKGQVLLRQGYEEVIEINYFVDIIKASYDGYNRSKDMYAGCVLPHNWKDLYEKYIDLN